MGPLLRARSGRLRSLGAAMAAAAIVAVAAATAGIDARATYGARVTADEPQYLLTAISLGEDASLDVSDELTEERFRPFHEVRLNQQTIDLDDAGRRVSPHDPLLPLLLALPVRIGGWFGAKLALALISGLVAALTLRLAVTRLGAPLGPATAIIAGFAAAPPLSVYGVQVYPAVPAALCVLVGVLATTDPVSDDQHGRRERGTGRLDLDVPDSLAHRHRRGIVVAAVVIALPWLSVKYVPVAATLAAAGLWRNWRGRRQLPLATLTAYGVAGVTYLGLHQLLYGGWTVYAAGDHFVNGEWLVVGSNPNYVGRSRRLIGLLVDRGFGIGAWNPAFLALPASLAWLVRSRYQARAVVLATFAVGWAVATWVALTMHGWWWPGRQVVPVVPLAVAAVAGLVGRSRAGLAAVLVGATLGAGSWFVLAWEASTGRRTLVVDFEMTANPWYQTWRLLLPDHRRMDPVDLALTACWLGVLLASAVVAARRAGAGRPTAPATTAADGATPTVSEGPAPDR